MATGSPDPDRALLRDALTRRLHRRSTVTGQFRVPAVPGLLVEYVRMCAATFAAVGRAFTDEQLDHLRNILEEQLAQAYSASSRSFLVISYEAAIGTTLQYHVRPEWSSVDAVYEDWLATREPPLFGTEPDARVWALAGESSEPHACPVLDIGAGTGRNALALARRGHPVDAVELTAKFADLIRAEAHRQSLEIRVMQRDVFDGWADLRRDYRLILLSEVVSDFRSAAQLRGVFELAADCLSDGGCLVLNLFLAKPGYEPDDAARELGQQVYTNVNTWDEIGRAAAGLPLELVPRRREVRILPAVPTACHHDQKGGQRSCGIIRPCSTSWRRPSSRAPFSPEPSWRRSFWPVFFWRALSRRPSRTLRTCRTRGP